MKHKKIFQQKTISVNEIGVQNLSQVQDVPVQFPTEHDAMKTY
jgi:hypothetical protein